MQVVLKDPSQARLCYCFDLKLRSNYSSNVPEAEISSLVFDLSASKRAFDYFQRILAPV